MKNLNQELYQVMYKEVMALLEKSEPTNAIEERCRQISDDVVLIAVVMKEAKNVHYARLRKEGFRLILVGCISGLSGFIITCINFNTSRSIDLAMYGLTTLGITLVFFGLFKIIG